MHQNEFLAHQKARQVEIMNHHVTIQSSGALDVIDRRRRRIAADDGCKFHRADVAIANAFFQGGKIRIEAAVKTDHQV